MQAYLSLARIRDQEKFGSWIAAVAGNVCNSYLRKPRDLLLPPEDIESLCAESSPATSDASASIARDILYGLPNGTRSAAVLYFVEEMKMTEIAGFWTFL